MHAVSSCPQFSLLLTTHTPCGHTHTKTHTHNSRRLKGVAGTHATVSVSTERLAGRTFATALRKGKAEQVVPGHGIILEVMLLPEQAVVA